MDILTPSSPPLSQNLQTKVFLLYDAVTQIQTPSPIKCWTSFVDDLLFLMLLLAKMDLNLRFKN